MPFDINIKWDNMWCIQEGISFTAIHLTDWVYIVVIWDVFPVSDWKLEIFEYWGIFRCCDS